MRTSRTEQSVDGEAGRGVDGGGFFSGDWKWPAAFALLVSVCVHAGLLGLLGVVVWRVAPGREVETVDSLELRLESLGNLGGVGVDVEDAGEVRGRETARFGPALLADVARGEAGERGGLASLAVARAGDDGSGGVEGLVGGLREGGGVGGADLRRVDEGVGRGGGGGVRFAGLGASRVGSVVFVIDASGPMVTSLPLVVAEVERAIGGLDSSQRFGVIALGDGGVDRGGDVGIRVLSAGLVRATDGMKGRASVWLGGLRPGGRSRPMVGLEAALVLRPDAVFLLSRGIERSAGGVWDVGKEETLARLELLNPWVRIAGGAEGERRRRTVIRTVQFIDEDPTGILEAIALAHGRTVVDGDGAGGSGGVGGGGDAVYRRIEDPSQIGGVDGVERRVGE